MKKILFFLTLSYAFMACENNTESKATKESVKTEAPNISQDKANSNSAFLIYECLPSAVEMFWKTEDGHIFKNFDSLDHWLQVKHQKQLIFAMNAGMYMEDNSPLGLYIEKGKTLRKLNTRNGSGNFYMDPNGIFLIDKKGKAQILPRATFKEKQIQFATQSGPMVLIEGRINKVFNQDSQNFNIRNGVGILPNGNCLFVMSKGLVTFYEFAQFFKEMGCKNALYLDGAISQTYFPQEGFKLKGGDFGVIIGVTEKL